MIMAIHISRTVCEYNYIKETSNLVSMLVFVVFWPHIFIKI